MKKTDFSQAVVGKSAAEAFRVLVLQNRILKKMRSVVSDTEGEYESQKKLLSQLPNLHLPVSSGSFGMHFRRRSHLRTSWFLDCRKREGRIYRRK